MTLRSRPRGGPGGSPGRSRTLLVTAVALAAVALAAGLFLAYRSHEGKKLEKTYLEKLEAGWEAFSDASEGVADALSAAGPAADLDIIESSVARALARLSKVEPPDAPSSMAELSGSSKRAASSMKAYLELLAEVAGSGDPAYADDRKPVLESRAVKARRDLTDLNEAVAFEGVRVNSDIFNGAVAVAGSFAAPLEEFDEAERDEAHGAFERFMESSMRRNEPDALWPMVSSTLRRFLEATGADPGEFARTWRNEWTRSEPDDFYVSPGSVSVEGVYAYVKGIVYPESGTPRIKTVRLVKEQDGWKVDCYPY